jgi:hypothetical protein
MQTTRNRIRTGIWSRNTCLISWNRKNRTGDPLGADQEKLVSTEGLRVYVDSLELTGDYRTEFYLGEDLDLSGMKVVAVISDGTRSFR